MVTQKFRIHNRIANLGHVVTDEAVIHIINECCKLAEKEWPSRKDDPLRIVQEIKSWPYN